jgi:hypothetical protein
VRTQAAREEHRGNRKVLSPRTAGDDGHVHPYTITYPDRPGQLVTFAQGPSEVVQSTGAGLPRPRRGRFVKPIQEGS